MRIRKPVPKPREGRKEPYSDMGIRRLRCVRCEARAEYQWSICSDGNLNRPICPACDIRLNAVALVFGRDPDWETKLRTYAAGKGFQLPGDLRTDVLFDLWNNDPI